MVAITIGGELYHINTVEELMNVQNILTTKFYEQSKDEEEIIERYFRDTPHLEIYDRVSDYPDLMSEIVDRAVENETDYQTLDEAADALRGMREALDEIYNYAREWT